MRLHERMAFHWCIDSVVGIPRNPDDTVDVSFQAMVEHLFDRIVENLDAEFPGTITAEKMIADEMPMEDMIATISETSGEFAARYFVRPEPGPDVPVPTDVADADAASPWRIENRGNLFG